MTHTSKTAKIGTINLVVEHIVTKPTYSATKFTVPVLAVFYVLVINTALTLISAVLASQFCLFVYLSSVGFFNVLALYSAS